MYFIAGVVYIWGEEDFGKVGRVMNDNCRLPKVVDKLNGIEICRVFSGLQICAALSQNGSLFTWYKLCEFLF